MYTREHKVNTCDSYTLRAETDPKNPKNPTARRPGRKRKPGIISLSNGIGPTTEHIRHIEIAGKMLQVDTYRTDEGTETQLKHLRISSPLEQLWKAGVLDAGQYGAARRYQRDADKAVIAGPGLCVRYEPRMIDGDGKRFLLPIEAAAEHLIRMALAQRACGAKYSQMLNWIAVEPMGWRDQARAWYPDSSETWARVNFKRLLRQCCSSLETCYKRT